VDAKRKKELKKMLLEMKENKTEEIRQNTKEIESADDFRNDAKDFADTASDSYEKELHYDLTEKNKKVLTEIEEALGRIEKNQYGKCEKCGKNISIERLKALPFSRLCIKCQSGAEK